MGVRVRVRVGVRVSVSVSEVRAKVRVRARAKVKLGQRCLRPARSSAGRDGSLRRRSSHALYTW